MIKRILPLFLIFAVVAACDEEEMTTIQSDSFVKYYNIRQVFTSADVKQNENDGYAILGTVETLSKGKEICLLRTDKYGNTMDSASYYGRNMDDQAYCLQVLSDGYAILGSSVNPQNENLEVYFIRTDTKGDTLWTRTIGRDDDVEAVHFEVDSDGSFIMTGYTNSTNEPNDKDIWLFAIDKEGNDKYQWSERIKGGSKDDEGRHLQLLDNGYIAIIGNTESYPSGTLTRNAYILITNNIGIPVAFLPVESLVEEDGNCIKMLDDDHCLLIGTMKSSLTNQGYDIIARKIDLSSYTLNTIWEWWYGTSGDDAGTGVIVDDAQYVLFGTTENTEGSSSICLIQTDQDGENAVYRNFLEGSNMTSTSFSKTSDNGFIMTGTNKITDTHSSIVLIKTKSDGTL